jgi:hypothetical protein
MISLSNTSAQTLTAGQNITFDTVLSKTGGAECHRQGTGSIKLCAKNAIYMIEFSANITNSSAADPVQLAIALGGDVLKETTMIFTPSAAEAVGHVSVALPVRNNCCDYDRITVVNNGTTDVTVSANPLLAVRRVA